MYRKQEKKKKDRENYKLPFTLERAVTALKGIILRGIMVEWSNLSCIRSTMPRVEGINPANSNFCL